MEVFGAETATIGAQRTSFNVATNIKLLGHISWPAGIGDEFIRNYKSGSIKLPQISYEKVDYRELEAELHKIKIVYTKRSN